MPQERDTKPIFVAGATGYIGARLVPLLLDAGYPVRALARAPEKLQNRPWAEHPKLEIVKGLTGKPPAIWRKRPPQKSWNRSSI